MNSEDIYRIMTCISITVAARSYGDSLFLTLSRFLFNVVVYGLVVTPRAHMNAVNVGRRNLSSLASGYGERRKGHYALRRDEK